MKTKKGCETRRMSFTTSPASRPLATADKQRRVTFEVWQRAEHLGRSITGKQHCGMHQSTSARPFDFDEEHTR